VRVGVECDKPPAVPVGAVPEPHHAASRKS
jgi:hypothetical protein